VGVALVVALDFEVALHLVEGKALLWLSDIGIAVANAAAAAAMAWRAHRTRGPLRRTWALTSASCAVWMVGQLAWSWIQLSGWEAIPFPSIADIAYIASLPLAAMAVLAMPRRGFTRSRSALDGLLAAGSTLVAAWAVLQVAAPGALDGAPVATTLALAYPVLNTAIAALVLVFAMRWRGSEARALGALAGAWGLLGLTCTAYGGLVIQGRYATGDWIDVGYVAAFGLIAAIGVRPPSGPVAQGTDSGRRVLALPYAPLIVALAAVATGRVRLDLVLTLGTMGVVAVVIIKQYVTIVENQALARELERRVVDRTAELATSEARYRRALAGAGVGSFELDLASGRTFWSLEAQAMHGVAPGTFAGTLEAAVATMHPDDRELVAEGLADLEDPGERLLEYRVSRPDGEIRWLSGRGSLRRDGNRRLLVGVITDITERRAAEAELARLAHTDALTGLPNRTQLLATLDAAFAAEQPVTLLVMDLDGFKEVNDGLGHETGDQLLVEVAARLRAGVRPSDLVARLGGDEFAVALVGTAEVAAGVTVAENLLAALGQPIEVAGLRLPIGVSVGISVAPEHGVSASDLLRHADVAMYRAKQRGGTWASFTPTADGGRAGRLALLADLRAAIDDDAIDVHYQPQLDLRTGRVVAVEALARWTHSTRGPVSPADFIPLAEHSGLIRDLTPLVLRRALEQCSRWRAEGLDIQVAVNLSPRLLSDSGLAAMIDRALLDARLAPGGLIVEITEGAFADETPAVERTLADLRCLGVRLSVDDFGTGYSSLAYLKRLPVDEVKIDRSFIAGLPGHADSGIVQAVLELARHLGLAVVAEGVEDEVTLDLLDTWGCPIAQGYLIARPQPATEITAWLVAREAGATVAD
jgi:diguanylate cyclase (GGDEF)-like protein/PAS domain S-box-containing protein